MLHLSASINRTPCERPLCADFVEKLGVEIDRNR
jgi:hypothetical protein